MANGHYWTQHDIDPTTGAEIPVSLTEMARREGKAPDFYIKEYGAKANQTIRAEQQRIDDALQQPGTTWSLWKSHFAEAGVGSWDGAFYTSQDRAFWAQLNNTPGYPGTGEGNLLVTHSFQALERDTISRDRRSFGSLTFLFATPPHFGPLDGKGLGALRANLVYRFFTGTPFNVTPLIPDPQIPGAMIGGIPVIRHGPMHTRMDLNLEKQFGKTSNPNVTLALEVFNLFSHIPPAEPEA